MTGLTQAMANFVANPTFGGQEQAACEIAKTGIMDTIATMMAGHEEPVVKIVRKFVGNPPAQGEAPVPFSGQMYSAADAAMINGTAGHALDYDDVALSGHPSTAIAPAILAAGYVLSSSGQDALRAYVIGYEIWAELASREKDPYHLKGWHPTGVFGAVAAAAAVAYLSRLSVEDTRQALAISASLASGLVANFGTMTKPFHAGRAAAHGIEAVRLSQLGLTSAADVFEHPAGFLHALSPAGHVDRTREADQLGKRYVFWRAEFPSNVTRSVIPDIAPLTACLPLQNAKNLKADQIKQVHLTMGPAQASMLRNHHPVTGLEAKFSAEFAVASAIVAREVGLSQLTDAFVTRPDVSRLFNKVSISVVNTVCPLDSAFSLTDRVVIETTDGRQFDSGEIRFPFGNAKNPIDTAGLKKKFLDCIATGKAQNPAMGGADDGLYDRLAKLESMPNHPYAVQSMMKNAADPLHKILSAYDPRQENLLPILHAVQDALGYIPPDSVQVIAHALSISHAEVHGVVTFYHHFRTHPTARHHLQVCRAEACRSMGAENLYEHAVRLCGNQANPTGSVTVQATYCLGLCATSPAVLLDDTPYGRVTPDALDTILDQVRGEKMSLTVYLPCDAASLAVGADQVAAKLMQCAREHAIDLDLIRNGSYGLLWLEPLLEIQTNAGRIAFGPVQADDIESLYQSGVFKTEGSPLRNISSTDLITDIAAIHPLCLGFTHNIPYLQKQQRMTFSRVGLIRPHVLDDYISHQGFKGLSRALSMPPEQIVQTILDSGLRGRGGAAFATGIKWKTALNASASQKYIVCNADEGDSGTFSDRMIMENDPFALIEGMIIAGLTIGATQGYLYVRSEYPQAFKSMEKAIDLAEKAGYLGSSIMGHGYAFRIKLRKAAGSYVCGEETALLESLEGKRGMVRAKPPLPAIKGLFGQPTVVNNVITLVCVPEILSKGALAYQRLGMDQSRGTLPFQLAGNIKRGGLIEVPFGITLRELVFDFGGGTASGRAVKAIQVGGPLGTYIPQEHWDLAMTYENYLAIGATLGHGGIVVHDDTVDMSELARYAMEFCALESCGKCTPCRIGSTRGMEVIDQIRTNRDTDNQTELLRDLCETMKDGSLCAMGSMTPNPVLSALNFYPSDFGQRDA